MDLKERQMYLIANIRYICKVRNQSIQDRFNVLNKNRAWLRPRFVFFLNVFGGCSTDKHQE